MAAPFQIGPIQVLPAGLLGLLQLKSPAGKNPQVMEGNVQPVFDLERYYLNQASEVVSDASVTETTTAGFRFFTTNPLVVPADQWWFVHNYTVYPTADLVAGDSVRNFSVGVRWRTVAPMQWARLGNDVVAGNTTGDALAAFAENFWLPPGSELGFQITLVAAVNKTFGATVRLTRCPV